jgi:HSP20 family protein
VQFHNLIEKFLLFDKYLGAPFPPLALALALASPSTAHPIIISYIQLSNSDFKFLYIQRYLLSQQLNMSSQLLARLSLMNKATQRTAAVFTNKALKAAAASSTQLLQHHRLYNTRSSRGGGSGDLSPFSGTSDIWQLFNDFDRLANSMFNFDRGLSRRGDLGSGRGELGARRGAEESQEYVPIGERGNLPATPIDAAEAQLPGGIPSPANLDFIKNLEPAATAGVKLDLDEEPDKYIVKVTVPGFKKEHLRIRLSRGYLTVIGEEHSETKDDNSAVAASRVVKQSIRLPGNIKPNEITARFEKDQLQILIPKQEATQDKPQGKQINIQ